MLKILNIFFVVLGVIFLALLIAGAYVVIADPFHLWPLVQMLRAPAASPAPSSAGASNSPAVPKGTTGGTTPSKNSLLTPEQAKTLESFGINPASLPTSITPVMEACFTEKLGAARVAEIKKGSAPTPIDFFTARACAGL